MKYALVNGQRQEARSDLLGVCPACGSPMIARCGDIRINHWAHRGKRICDPWWENETEWHRSWKELFPNDWQECVHIAESGEKHIADVKTDKGWVLEFQHSKINPDERNARENFYQKLIWIVDGTRRIRDKSQFIAKVNEGQLVYKQIGLRRISFPDECALLRDWVGSHVPVFIDFSGCNKLDEELLWCLIKVIDKMAYILPFPMSMLIEYNSPEATGRGFDFAASLKKLHKIVNIIARPRQDSRNDLLKRILMETERQYRERQKKSKRSRRF